MSRPRLLLQLLSLVLLLPSLHAFSSILRSPVRPAVQAEETPSLVDLELKEFRTAAAVAVAQNDTFTTGMLRTTTTTIATIPRDYAQAQRKEIFVGFLAIFYAFSDILSLKTFDCFSSMMTGNMIRCSMALLDGRWVDALYRGALVANYIVGAALYKVIQSKKHVRVAPTAFVIFGAADIVARLAGKQYSPLVMALAFGIINADAHISSGVVANAATGHMSRVGQSIGDFVVSGTPVPKTSIRFLTWFGSGLVLSNLLHQFWMKSLPSPPVGTVLGLAYWGLSSWYDSARKGSRMPLLFRHWMRPERMAWK